ncbi:hypothetical protein HNR65_002139 [Desulfosalsimonas propionicica]|uniref:Uncharacterized protein n=1 Tax=Desulfosalsimonas propionicica TaxID=332175 RepID=A0A7W0HL23_9BACT|nr:hypothetical protein [Desulfosalsimonas propionicica]MBA2881808.1 hypothetical protein [Desulfosalsimonas propionicica]
MNREPKAPPLRSWQVFSAGIYHIKKDVLARMFGVSLRQVERWAADPDTTESHQKNPIDRLEAMCRAFMTRGQSEIARIIAARLAYVVNCELRDVDDVEPSAETIQHECLEDYPPVTRFHAAINEYRDAEQVRHFLAEAKRELNETYQMYLRGEHGKGGVPAEQEGQRD